MNVLNVIARLKLATNAHVVLVTVCLTTTVAHVRESSLHLDVIVMIVIVTATMIVNVTVVAEQIINHFLYSKKNDEETLYVIVSQCKI